MGKTPTLNKKRDLTLYILPLKSQSSFNRVSVSNLEVTDRQTESQIHTRYYYTSKGYGLNRLRTPQGLSCRPTIHTPYLEVYGVVCSEHVQNICFIFCGRCCTISWNWFSSGHKLVPSASCLFRLKSKNTISAGDEFVQDRHYCNELKNAYNKTRKAGTNLGNYIQITF